MKKFITLLLAAMMLLSLAACAAKDTTAPDTDDSGDSSVIQDEQDGSSADNENTDDSNTPDENQSVSPDNVTLADSSLSDIMAAIQENVTDLPGVGETPLDADNFEFYAFTKYADGYEGLASDAMISAVAHSAVLIRVPDGTDIDALKADIESNADPRKWICVEAEKTTVSVNGNVILLVMSFDNVADEMTANFLALK